MLKKIKNILIPYNLKIVPVFVLMLISNLFEVISIGSIIPLLAIITDQGFYNSNMYVEYFINNIYYLDENQFIIACFILLLAAFFFRFIFVSITIWVKNNFTYHVQKDVSQKLLKKYLFKNYSFFFKENTATLINNVDKESHHFVVGILSPIIILMIEFFAIIFILSFLFYYDPLSTISIFMVIISFSLIFIYLTRERLSFLGIQRKIDENSINKILIEGFSGIKDIKLVQAENFFLKKFSKKIKNLCTVLAKQKTIDELSRPIFEFISILCLIILLMYLYLIDKNLSEIFIILGIFLAASLRLLPSANRVITSIQSIRFYKTTVDIIYKELIEGKSDSINSNNTKTLEFENSINIENLTFCYPGTKKIILENANLNISKGETIGVFGESGSGKTTLVDLLSGFLKPDKGKILCDENDISNLIIGWRKLIGYVPQSIFIIDDTIKNNICLGLADNEIDETSLKYSIDKSQLEKLINSLPEGYNSSVGDKGIGLSLGQIQRIGIARALYWQKPIIIFDESTSSLDPQNEKEIMNDIKKLKGKKTIIIISHKKEVLDNCDKVYMIDKKKFIQVN